MIRVINITDITYADQLHYILLEAFTPFRSYYTDDAFWMTVVSVDVFKERITSPDYTVYGAFTDNHLVGTVSSKMNKERELYFMSMAVLSSFAGKGVGKELLHCIEEEAKANRCLSISLETYKPLFAAIKLYETNGFVQTGRKRDYGGIEIFEMKKIVNREPSSVSS